MMEKDVKINDMFEDGQHEPENHRGRIGVCMLEVCSENAERDGYNKLASLDTQLYNNWISMLIRYTLLSILLRSDE